MAGARGAGLLDWHAGESWHALQPKADGAWQVIDSVVVWDVPDGCDVALLMLRLKRACAHFTRGEQPVQWPMAT